MELASPAALDSGVEVPSQEWETELAYGVALVVIELITTLIAVLLFVAIPPCVLKIPCRGKILSRFGEYLASQITADRPLLEFFDATIPPFCRICSCCHRRRRSSRRGIGFEYSGLFSGTFCLFYFRLLSSLLLLLLCVFVIRNAIVSGLEVSAIFSILTTPAHVVFYLSTLHFLAAALATAFFINTEALAARDLLLQQRRRKLGLARSDDSSSSDSHNPRHERSTHVPSNDLIIDTPSARRHRAENTAIAEVIRVLASSSPDSPFEDLDSPSPSPSPSPLASDEYHQEVVHIGEVVPVAREEEKGTVVATSSRFVVGTEASRRKFRMSRRGRGRGRGRGRRRRKNRSRLYRSSSEDSLPPSTSSSSSTSSSHSNYIGSGSSPSAFCCGCCVAEDRMSCLRMWLIRPLVHVLWVVREYLLIASFMIFSVFLFVLVPFVNTNGYAGNRTGSWDTILVSIFSFLLLLIDLLFCRQRMALLHSFVMIAPTSAFFAVRTLFHLTNSGLPINVSFLDYDANSLAALFHFFLIALGFILHIVLFALDLILYHPLHSLLLCDAKHVRNCWIDYKELCASGDGESDDNEGSESMSDENSRSDEEEIDDTGSEPVTSEGFEEDRTSESDTPLFFQDSDADGSSELSSSEDERASRFPQRSRSFPKRVISREYGGRQKVLRQMQQQHRRSGGLRRESTGDFPFPMEFDGGDRSGAFSDDDELEEPAGITITPATSFYLDELTDDM